MQSSRRLFELPVLEKIIDRSPVTVTPDTSASKALALIGRMQGCCCSLPNPNSTSDSSILNRDRIDCVLVVEESRLVGIFTERDVVRLAASGANLGAIALADVMTRQVICLTLSDSQDIFAALALLRQHRLRHLPVVDDCGQLLGLITPQTIRQVLQPANFLKLRRTSEMMETQVNCAPTTASAMEIAQLMAERQVSCVVILENDKPVGIITERDIVQFQVLELDLERTQAWEIMSTPLFGLHPNDSLMLAHEEMQRRRTRRLTVIGDEGELLGILTQTSFLQAFDPVELSSIITVLEQRIEERTAQLAQEIAQRQQVEEELRQTHVELERRVRERTSELAQTNEQLQETLAEKHIAEEEIRRQNEELASARQALELERQHYQDLFEFAPDGYLLTDAAGTIQAANRAATTLLSVSEDRPIGQPLIVYIAEPDRKFFRDRLTQLQQGQTVRDWEICLRSRAGKLIPVAIAVTGVYNFHRQPIGLRWSIRDIRDRIQTEAALRASEEQRRLAIDLTKTATWDWDIVTGTVVWSDRMFQLFGLTSGTVEPSYNVWRNCIHPDDLARLETMIQNHLQNQTLYEAEYRVVHPDGTIHWMLSKGQGVRNASGQLVRMVGITMDINDRKQAEESLRANESLLKSVFEQTAVGIAIGNLSGQFMKANQVYQNIVGYSEEELTSLRFIEITHPEDREGNLALFAELLDGKRDSFQIEKRYLRKDGNCVWIKNTVSLIAGGSGQSRLVLAIVEDICDRKQAEQKLREQAALINIANDAIFVTDLERRILFWNQGAERIYGWNVAEAIGRNASDLLFEEISPQLEEALKTVLETGNWQGELNKIAKGDRAVIVASRWTLMRDEAGQPKSILTVDTDITEKKQLEKQFLRAQRLESLGTLAGGIAHDFNNLLTPILTAAQILPLTLPDLDPQERELLKAVEESAKRGADLVKQILSFARGDDGERAIVQVAHLLREVVKIAKSTFPKSVDIKTSIPQKLETVSADATHLHQVLMNLIVNARDAMPDGGTLTIAAENALIDECYARMNLDARVGTYVAIAISDTGMGMPPEVLERIFEPFFTTKALGKGTGLGLSTVIGIVKSHGGFITVESEVGVGSQFKVYLPAAKGREIQPSENFQLFKGKGELILVVDDEARIRETAKISLEAYNYEVLLASDGIDAIALYAQNQGRIAAVVMDILMPSVSGIVAIRALQKLNPQVKVIATSGRISSDRLAETSDLSVAAFLSKPYTVEELLQTLQRVLD